MINNLAVIGIVLGAIAGLLPVTVRPVIAKQNDEFNSESPLCVPLLRQAANGYPRGNGSAPHAHGSDATPVAYQSNLAPVVRSPPGCLSVLTISAHARH